ncbi:MAG: hypothetical protein JWN02_2545 [Acidobacteria bacterium]|nr:hypothetical protein [Acidobacteriota bacterium]
MATKRTAQPAAKASAKPAEKPAAQEKKAPPPPAEAAPRAARKTERVNVWLTPEQVVWLKAKKNLSETVRALLTEAMNMENLARSVKQGKKK